MALLPQVWRVLLTGFLQESEEAFEPVCGWVAFLCLPFLFCLRSLFPQNLPSIASHMMKHLVPLWGALCQSLHSFLAELCVPKDDTFLSAFKG